jgi:hypothetical protein
MMLEPKRLDGATALDPYQEMIVSIGQDASAWVVPIWVGPIRKATPLRAPTMPSRKSFIKTDELGYVIGVKPLATSDGRTKPFLGSLPETRVHLACGTFLSVQLCDGSCKVPSPGLSGSDIFDSRFT